MTVSKPLHSSAQRVQEALNAYGVACQVVELPDSTRSAQEAADAIGCEVGQIVKSLIFRGKQTGTPILVLASGMNRVNEKRLKALIGEPISKADADFVRQKTGFAIGGVAPVGHAEPLTAYIDEDLLQYAEIWAAAGTPHAVFRLTPEDLLKIARGQVVNVT